MKIRKVETWENASGLHQIHLVENAAGNVVCSELYLSPMSDCSIEVKGFTGDNDSGKVLAAIDMLNLKKINEITEAGTYCFVTSPYTMLEVNISGTSTINVKQLF